MTKEDWGEGKKTAFKYNWKKKQQSPQQELNLFD